MNWINSVMLEQNSKLDIKVESVNRIFIKLQHLKAFPIMSAVKQMALVNNLIKVKNSQQQVSRMTPKTQMTPQSAKKLKNASATS